MNIRRPGSQGDVSAISITAPHRENGAMGANNAGCSWLRLAERAASEATAVGGAAANKAGAGCRGGNLDLLHLSHPLQKKPFKFKDVTDVTDVTRK